MKESRKIKILQVTGEPITIWAFLTELIKELENRGFDVEAACNNKDEDLIKELEEKGIKLNIINIQRSINPIKVIKAFIGFRKLFKEEKYDIVAAHTPIASFISRMAAYFSKVPIIIYTAHGLPFTKNMSPIKYSIFYILEKIVGFFTTAVICINHEDYLLAKEKRLVRTGLVKEICGIGIDVAKFRKTENCELRMDREKEAFSDENPKRILKQFSIKTIGFIGRLVEEKGVKEYLQMAERILEARDDVRFVIAGYGSLEAYVRDFIRENKLEKSIKFLGFRKDIVDVMGMFDIFVLPTYYPEGLPRTILEAMSMEIPVVTTNIRGCRQLIEDGKNGYLVPIKDVDKLVDSVEKILDNEELAKEMGKYSRDKVVKSYEIGKIVDEQIEFYEGLLRNRAK